MKTTRLKLIVATAALAFAGAAFAGAPWTYIDLAVNTADSSAVSGGSNPNDDRTIGYGLRGSFGFANIWHVGAAVQSTEWNGGKDKPFGVDETGYDIYVGVHPAMSDNTDLVLDIGYATSEGEVVGLKDDVTAVYLRTGPRALIAGDRLELFAYLTLATGDNKLNSPSTDWTGVGATLGGQYYFTPAWSLGAEAAINGAATPASEITSEDQLKIFLRWSFGDFR